MGLGFQQNLPVYLCNPLTTGEGMNGGRHQYSLLAPQGEFEGPDFLTRHAHKMALAS
jgi:hypothetical protein